MFIEEHLDKRLFIMVENFEDFKEKEILSKLTTILKKECNITFCYLGNLTVSQMRDIAHYAKQFQYAFCFEKYVSSFESLYGMLELGVSDVYISSDLGFNIKIASEIIRSYNAKLRCYPDICQTDWPGLNPIFCFWIRPEDIELYSQYIDVLEFWKDKGDAVIADTLYELYGIKREWHGDLSSVVTDMLDNIKSNCILPAFGIHRINCNRKCFKGSNCKLCNYVLDIASTLRENDLYIKSQEEDEDDNGED